MRGKGRIERALVDHDPATSGSRNIDTGAYLSFNGSHIPCPTRRRRDWRAFAEIITLVNPL